MKIYLAFVILILVIVGLNTMAQKFLKQRWTWLGYGVPAIAMILFLTRASKPPSSDLFGDFLKAYYPAGRLIVQNPFKLYDIDLSNNPFFGFVNVPIIALLFTPFSALNKPAAVILFTLLSVLVVLVTCYFLARITEVVGWNRIALLELFVINGPLYHSLWYGNLSHFVLLLLLAVLFCLKKHREVWLGVLLAIAALIKIPLFFLGVYFTMRGRWGVIAGFGATLLVIVGSSLLLFGIDLHLAWLHHIKHFSGKPVSAYNVQSVDGFLARLLTNTNDELRNFQPIEVDWRFRIIRYVLLSLLIGATIWICWRSKPPTTLAEENLEFSIVLCLALVVSPISWTHYYIFLLLPFALYLGKKLAIPKGRLWSSLVVVSIFLTSLPVITAGSANPAFQFLYSRLLISHYFFGGVLFLGVLLAARWHTAKCSKLSPGKETFAL